MSRFVKFANGSGSAFLPDPLDDAQPAVKIRTGEAKQCGSGDNVSVADHARHKRNFLRGAFRNATASAGGTIATAAVQFVFAGLSIRYLGTGRAGFLLALQTLAGLNSLFGDLGLGLAAIRQVAILKAAGQIKEARETIASVCVISGATALGLTLIILFYFENIFRWSKLEAQYFSDAKLAAFLTLAGFVVTQLTSPWRAAYGALERYEILGAMNSSSGLVSGLGGIAILTIAPTMTSLAAVRTAVTILRAIADSHILRRLLNATPWPMFHWLKLRPLLSLSSWVYVDSLGGTLIARANSIILTQFVGSSALPYYELPQRVYTQIHGILASQSQFLLPLLSSYSDNAISQIQRVEDRLRWLLAIIAIHIYVPAALLGPAVIAYLVTPSFAVACTPLLYLACLQGLFLAVDIVPYYASLAVGSAKANSISHLIQGSLAACTAFLLIPRLGYIGAGFAQIWVIPVVAFHMLLVARLIPREARSAPRLEAFVSPACMLIVWLLVSWAATKLGNGLACEIFSVIGGAIAGWCAVIALERIAYSSRLRMETLGKILRELSRRFFPYKRF
jgi:O-antigen/teichoic acid export membrane protein